MDAATVADSPAQENRAEMVSGVLGRLLYAPRARPQETTERLALVERMLRSGGGYWRAEDLADTPDDVAQLRQQLKELRRIGLLRWDEGMGGYALLDELRVPVALALLACAPAPPRTDQLKLLDVLVPFAQLATRGDLRGAPAWAMLDLLERDVRAMEEALTAGPQRLADLAQERWLIRSAQDMDDTISRLRALEDSDIPGARELVQRAVDLLLQAGERIARLSVRMSRSARDHLRLAGSRRSPAELRAAVAQLDMDELADCVSATAGLAPTIVRLPDELELAAHLPDELHADPTTAERVFPDSDDLHEQQIEEPPPAPDARKVAEGRLAAAPARKLAVHLFGELTSWQEAVRLQHGLIRLQAEAARFGHPGWQSVPDPVHLPEGSPISWLWEIERAQAESEAA